LFLAQCRTHWQGDHKNHHSQSCVSIDIAFIKINHASDLKPVQVFQEKRIGRKIDQAFN
jgi:hypothetical protein